MYSQALDNVSKLLGGDPEVDGERQAAVLFADLVVDDPDDLVPVADNRFGPQAEGVVPVGVGDCLGSLREQVFDDLLPIGADHHVVVVEGAVLEGDGFHGSCKIRVATDESTSSITALAFPIPCFANKGFRESS